MIEIDSCWAPYVVCLCNGQSQLNISAQTFEKYSYMLKSSLYDVREFHNATLRSTAVTASPKHTNINKLLLDSCLQM
jgi:hypothetical protein